MSRNCHSTGRDTHDIADIPNGPSGMGDPLASVSKTIDRYLFDRKQLGELTRATARQCRYHLDSFARHVGATLAVGALTQDHVEGWLIAQRCATSTKYTRYSSVRAFVRWCVTHRFLRHDPCIGIRGPRRPKPVPRCLAHDEIRRVLECADARTVACVLLGTQEGLRRAEIAALSTSDIDSRERLLRVQGKGNKERYVPLSDETRIAIDRYLRDAPAGPNVPLFRRYDLPHLGLGIRQVGDAITEAMFAAGVKHKAFDGKSAHALRHTCANDMLDNGADLRDVSEMLGHASLSVTADVYARRLVALGRLRDAAAGRTYL